MDNRHTTDTICTSKTVTVPPESRKRKKMSTNKAICGERGVENTEDNCQRVKEFKGNLIPHSFFSSFLFLFLFLFSLLFTPSLLHTNQPKMDPHARYQSPLTSRYASPEMAANFSDNKRFSTWRKLWLNLAIAEKELGLDIPEGAIEQMKEHIVRSLSRILSVLSAVFVTVNC